MAPKGTPETPAASAASAASHGTEHELQARTGSVPAEAIRRRLVNVGDTERWASVAAGALAGLWASGSRRHGAGRLAMATASALLLERGLTGTCRLYRAMGLNTATAMPRDGWRALEEAQRDLVAQGRRSIDRAVTILRPRLEVGTALRNLARWPLFVDLIEAAEIPDAHHARLHLRSADGRRLTCLLELDEDLPEAALAWRVFDEAGQRIARLAVGLADAPGGRGTELRFSAVADVAVPGVLAALLANLAGEAPEQQARRVLRRFKQLMETGEVISAAGPSGRRAPDRLFRRALRTRSDASPRLPSITADLTSSPTGGL